MCWRSTGRPIEASDASLNAGRPVRRVARPPALAEPPTSRPSSRPPSRDPAGARLRAENTFQTKTWSGWIPDQVRDDGPSGGWKGPLSAEPPTSVIPPPEPGSSRRASARRKNLPDQRLGLAGSRIKSGMTARQAGGKPPSLGRAAHLRQPGSSRRASARRKNLQTLGLAGSRQVRDDGPSGGWKGPRRSGRAAHLRHPGPRAGIQPARVCAPKKPPDQRLGLAGSRIKSGMTAVVNIASKQEAVRRRGVAQQSASPLHTQRPVQPPATSASEALAWNRRARESVRCACMRSLARAPSPAAIAWAIASCSAKTRARPALSRFTETP